MKPNELPVLRRRNLIDEPARSWKERLLDTALVAVGTLILLLLLSWMHVRDAEDEVTLVRRIADAHERAATLFAANLATCMNGGVVVDRNSKTAYFCGKPVSVPLP